MTSLKKMSKAINYALNRPELYDDEEYAKLKKQAHEIKKLRQRIINDEKAYRGFGYTYAPFEPEITSETDLGDATSGTDDGVYSEGEQPIESGEPERSGTTEVLHQA